eukprot:CAMPEP_0118940754 /NCGR_PEP_ID=MMETSP1169-20130426/32201_1 /TAXON_ID=36882 /ORGANISM="Pyramimonas obovata, Strain CCMP722" /LENGTH=481 /DNA_ID=CAMNT_0006885329 /DNA_START=284 /DNA_END=1725 /DNA_ORIENTATION=+
MPAQGILPEVGKRPAGGAELGLSLKGSTGRRAHFEDDVVSPGRTGRLPAATGAHRQGQTQQADVGEPSSSTELGFPRVHTAVPTTPLGMLGLTLDEYHDAIKEVEDMNNAQALQMAIKHTSMPFTKSVGGGGGAEDTALPIPDGFTGCFGRTIVHHGIPGVGEFAVLKALVQRQREELSRLKAEIHHKEKVFEKINQQYMDEVAENSKTMAKAVGQVAGAPINLPVQILERKMEEAQIKIERANNQTKSFTHIHDRTFHNLNEVKMAVEDMEAEYKQQVTEGESMANDLSFISARAQEEIVKLRNLIQEEEERKKVWNQQRDWAHSVLQMIAEGRHCIETQLGKRDKLVLEMDLTVIGKRKDQSLCRVPAQYVEAMKTQKARSAFEKINEYATKLRHSTGQDDPREWVATITDKLGNIKESIDGTLEPSCHFLLKAKSDELANTVEELKRERQFLKEELYSLRFEDKKGKAEAKQLEEEEG